MRFTLLMALLFCYNFSVTTAQTRIIDEIFSDWTTSQLIFQDVHGDVDQGFIDFRDCWMADDEKNIYLSFELGQEINLLNSEDFFIYVDIDNNSSTGVAIQNMGADFVYEIGEGEGYLRLPSNQNFAVYHDDVKFVSLPSVSSDRFEISFSKTIRYFDGQFRTVTVGNEIKFAVADERFMGDHMPDAGGISYSMSNAPFAPPAYQLQSNPDDFRLMSYNVFRDALFDTNKFEAYARIFQSMNPDVICFQEVYEHSGFQVATLIESILPSAPGEQWYYNQVAPDIITVSRYPIINTYSTNGNGIFELDVDGQQLILVNAHLPCCDKNIERQYEVDNIMSFIRNSIDGQTNLAIDPSTPILITGDMNLVGDRQQQLSLATGDIVNESTFGPDFNPDWDASPLEDARPIHTGGVSAATWLNPFSSFSSGRLDYVFYTGSVVELRNGFALNPAGLTPGELSAFNLQVDDVIEASDHFPCILDFDMSPENNVNQHPRARLHVLAHPNPTTSALTLSIPDKIETILIYSTKGKLINNIKWTEHENKYVTLNLSRLPTGLYFIRAYAADKIYEANFMKN